MKVEYVCRCGKRSFSLFEQKRHVKYWCPLKHVPIASSGKAIRVICRICGKNARASEACEGI